MNTLTQHPTAEPGRLKTVVLYGNSLAVTTFGACLRETPGVRLLSMTTDIPDEVPRLRDLKPDIVLFDLAAALPSFAVALWKTNPSLLLIGVDLLRGELLVLGGSREQVLSVGDLIKVMRGERPHNGNGRLVEEPQ